MPIDNCYGPSVKHGAEVLVLDVLFVILAAILAAIVLITIAGIYKAPPAYAANEETALMATPGPRAAEDVLREISPSGATRVKRPVPASDKPSLPSSVAAAGRLESQAALAKVALDDPDWRVRLAATKRLEDPDALERIALYDTEPTVQGLAREMLDVMHKAAQIRALRGD